MHLAHATSASAPSFSSALAHIRQVQALKGLLLLLFFFLSTAEIIEGAINGDQAKV
jgi:hypothetical protein